MFHPTKDLTPQLMSQPKALVVLSGGQDSCTCLFWAVQQYGAENVYAITFDYNQRHKLELNAAQRVADLAGLYAPDTERHEILILGPILKSASPLVDHRAGLEMYQDYASMDKIIGDRVEMTFVPMRNALFLTLAANRAVALGATTIVTGVCQSDNANYPDCRQDFITRQEVTINTALGLPPLWSQGGGIRIETPLMDMSKAQSIKFAWNIPGAYSALAYTHTAYDGQYPPVGSDHASVLRAHGFEEADMPDPLVLRAWKQSLMELPRTGNYRGTNIKLAFGKIEAEMKGTTMPRWWPL